MAIDFPNSPTPGQVFQGYYWDNDKNAWRSQSTNRGSVITSATTPTGASAGDLWFNTVDGTIYVYYDDGITTQWIEARSMPSSYVASSSSVRDSYFGVPADETQRLALQNSGVQCFRSDKGWTEQYLATYNSSTNPGGATPAGWYPFQGVKPAARLIRPANQSTSGTSGTATKIEFNSVVFDTANLSGPNTYSLTAPVAGIYHVLIHTAYASGNAALFFNTRLHKNDVFMGQSYFEDLTPGQSGQYPWPQINTMVNLAAGDFLSVYMSVNGTSQTLQGDRCSFEMIYVGPAR